MASPNNASSQKSAFIKLARSPTWPHPTTLRPGTNIGPVSSFPTWPHTSMVLPDTNTVHVISIPIWTDGEQARAHARARRRETENG